MDLGQSTGWALYKDGVIVSGTHLFKRTYFDGGGVIFVWFQNFLNELHKRNGPIDHVFFEAVRRHKGTIAAHCYGGFMATLQTFCEQHAIPHEGISVGDIKQNWCNARGASKLNMMAECKLRGFSPSDDNEADAIAILHFGLEKNGIHMASVA